MGTASGPAPRSTGGRRERSGGGALVGQPPAQRGLLRAMSDIVAPDDHGYTQRMIALLVDGLRYGARPGPSPV